MIRGRKLNISLIFITQSYVKVPKDVRLNSFLWWYQEKETYNEVAINHSSDIDFRDFMKIIKKFTTKPSCFLVNNTTLPPDEILRLRKKIKSKFSRQLKHHDNQ